MEPAVEKFSLPTTLPKRLADLGVNIAVQQTSVVLQYSIHLCPRQMKRELRLVFPSLSGKENDLLIIPTFQKTKSSMISYDAETQIEKDEKLELFYRWGTDLVERLREKGFWADITDPMSGAALFSTSGPSLYPDVESAEILLRYRPFNLGSCFVMSHPNWGTHVYPATAFTLAPADVVARVLADMQAGPPPAR
ncbi:hypothetical protein BX661DRAFT_170621 [Kickxella alabastrina]|uniref:uncharacterized protein n=1 Tax=Kickxella alabastrina TaxID=61397 RepID=UPI00221FC82C|nr:uncharacterized protein BX661DRAFT_170621 [Kickxella alabastrina]KAI7829190.1 hypothetical protein BX661DRAFT_170621 [Kickxella alabastrina]KAJ1946870.1 hypothetical protein GGF37_000876 [Kickxella alabastrina]